ncbi:MAG: hypothetical protein JWR61_1714 [Ferruginibacter sp.]|uniref:hypothetical protein n=1 Tax=Ferruginibacter sp. TaxID=1940288 RepID=UPI0026584562|nr:hypothetical protein [Ferruginibacter sp.]MDB5276759.1 hypothetical protein [Ferruginibacter sp.]
MKTINYKKIILPVAFAFLAFAASAQTIINEDFLDNIEDNAKTLWAENIPAFATNIVPDKYKNESAIVFGFKRSVTIDKKSRFGFLSRGERSLLFFENVRFKIKLNDKNAVKSFTEIYFRYSDKTDGFSARITKPDSSSKVVALNDAVGVESISDVPEFFKSFFDQQVGAQKRYYKVAVPDLEPGDILEYVTNTKSKLDVKGTGYIEFDPQYEVCNKSYPILFNQINIETDNKSFFKSLSINGAPDFKKADASDDGFFKYVFTDSDRGVEKDVNFISSFQVYPLTKFQVIYANNEKIKGALIGQAGEIKTGFTKEELAKKAWEDFEQTGNYYYPEYGTVYAYASVVWSQLKKQGVKDLSDKEFLNLVYYKMRNIAINRDNYFSDKVAAYIFSFLLSQKDIHTDILISVSNTLGKLSNILFDQELRYVCKVNNSFYFNWTDHSNPGDLVENLLGSEAWIIDKPTKQNTQNITPVQLPDAGFQDNVSDYTINASLAADMSTWNVSRVSTYTGISKTRNIYTALKYTPYMLDDYKYYGGSSPTEKMKDAQEEEYIKSVKALKDEFKEAKVEQVKSELQGEFQQKIKYKNFAISSDGRSLKAKNLVYTEDFELAGMVRKAGKKYLVNIAGLVGSQLQIKKEERVRKYDINVGYARTLNWTINFKIPDGYTAEGVKELKTSIDNETGTFTCDAEEQNGMVVLKIKKIYKKANNLKDKWPAMLAFIDAAYNSSFKYILLKPKS